MMATARRSGRHQARRAAIRLVLIAALAVGAGQGGVADAQQDDWRDDITPPPGCPGAPVDGVSIEGTVCPDGSPAETPPDHCMGGGGDQMGGDCPELPPMGCIGGVPFMPYGYTLDESDLASCPDGTTAQPMPPHGCPGGPAWDEDELGPNWVEPDNPDDCPYGDEPPYSWPDGCPDSPGRAQAPSPGKQCPDGSVPRPPQSSSQPGCPGGLSRVPPAENVECPNGEPWDHTDVELDPVDTTARDRLAEELFGDTTPEDTIPLGAYEVTCGAGSGLSDAIENVRCILQALPFDFAKGVIALGSSLLSWALDWQIADALTPAAGLLSDVYDTSLLGPINLRHFAWTAAVIVGGWHVLRARTARGIGEIAATMAIAAIGAFVIANPAGYLEGTLELAQNTSGAIVETVDSAEPDEDYDPVERLTHVMHRVFIAEPYDWLQWGEPLEGACAEARDEILATGPHGNDDEPRDIMEDAGCEDAAAFNERPSGNRMIAGAVNAITAILTTLLLALVALSVVFAQLTLVFAFSVTSIVWVLALFPGSGRHLLRWWLYRLLSAVTAAVGATFLLLWLAIAITTLLDVLDHLTAIQRGLVTLVVVIFAFKIRGTITRLGQTLADRTSEHVNRLSPDPAHGHGGLGGAGLASAQGYGRGPTGQLATASRQFAADVPGGRIATYALDRAYLRFLVRRHRRPVSRLAHGVTSHMGSMIRNTPRDLRMLGRGVAAIPMAPVLLPRAYSRGVRRATEASQRARGRLHQARDTGRQWSYAVAHPINTMQAAHQQGRAGTPSHPGRFRRAWHTAQRLGGNIVHPFSPARPSSIRSGARRPWRRQPPAPSGDDKRSRGTRDSSPRTGPLAIGDGRPWRRQPPAPSGDSKRWRGTRDSSPRTGPLATGDGRPWRRQPPAPSGDDKRWRGTRDSSPRTGPLATGDGRPWRRQPPAPSGGDKRSRGGWPDDGDRDR